MLFIFVWYVLKKKVVRAFLFLWYVLKKKVVRAFLTCVVKLSKWWSVLFVYMCLCSLIYEVVRAFFYMLLNFETQSGLCVF